MVFFLDFTSFPIEILFQFQGPAQVTTLPLAVLFASPLRPDGGGPSCSSAVPGLWPPAAVCSQVQSVCSDWPCLGQAFPQAPPSCVSVPFETESILPSHRQNLFVKPWLQGSAFSPLGQIAWCQCHLLLLPCSRGFQIPLKGLCLTSCHIPGQALQIF